MKKKAVFLLMTGAILTACGGVNGRGVAPISETWDDFSAGAPSDQAPQHLGGLTFYRLGDLPANTTANIYVNGEYLTSLLPNAYKQSVVCPGQARLETALTGHDPAYRQKSDAGMYYDLPGGQVQYFKVIAGAGGNADLIPVDAGIAMQEISGLREQNHTLPRVSSNNCAAQVIANYPLQVEALFAYNRSGAKDILPKGRAEINALADRLKGMQDPQIQVTLVGHADPVGSDSYNQALSERRAQTVKQVLQRQGVTQPITATGQGERAPVVTGCEAVGSKRDINACNQPNRRVDVTIYGSPAH